MFKRWIFVCLLMGAAAARAADIPEMPAVAARPTVATVPVNCAAGQSVQAAIDGNAGPLEVVISGLCTENVTIRDKDVTLRGAFGPSQDGIRSTSSIPALTVRGTGIDTIASLSFSKSSGPAVMIRGVNATLSGCEFASNTGTALNVTMGAYVMASGLVFDGNVGRNIAVTDSQFFCTGCDVVNTNNFAVVANRGATASLLDSVVSGKRGILAADGGTLADLDCVTAGTSHPCSMRVTGVAAQSVGDASLTLFGSGDFTGQVTATERGTVALVGSRQISGAQSGLGPSTNVADFFGQIAVANLDATTRSVLLSTNLSRFSRLVVSDDSSVNGTVQCTTAADAVLDPTVVARARFTGCEHVVSIVR